MHNSVTEKNATYFASYFVCVQSKKAAQIIKENIQKGKGLPFISSSGLFNYQF